MSNMIKKMVDPASSHVSKVLSLPLERGGIDPCGTPTSIEVEACIRRSRHKSHPPIPDPLNEPKRKRQQQEQSTSASIPSNSMLVAQGAILCSLCVLLPPRSVVAKKTSRNSWNERPGSTLQNESRREHTSGHVATFRAEVRGMDDTSGLDLTFEDALRRAREDLNHLCIPGVEVEAVSADGVACEWLRSDASDPKRVILYLHGGGYVSCSLLTHRNIMSRLSSTSRALVLGVDYRLAPVHPFPCALEDATKAYCWLLNEGYSHKQIALAGDSAGGGLALALLQKLKMGRDNSVPPLLPSACVLFSPWTDLTIGGKSIIDNYETDRLFNPKRKKMDGPLKWLKAARIKLSWRLVAKMYAQWPTSLKDPLVSPLFGDLSGLPPTLIHCTAVEMLLDDSLRLSKILEENGVPVKCKVWERAMHVFPAFDPKARETVECLADVATFLDGIWSAIHMQEDEISDQVDTIQEHEQCTVPLLAKASFHEKMENRVSQSIWLAVLIIGPGAALSLVNGPAGMAAIACTFVGYKMSRRMLRKLHKKVHLTVQNSVHRGLNEMYKREYNGQSIDHPYGK